MELTPAIFKKCGLSKKQREALAWWLCDGHTYTKIAEWQKCCRQVAERRVKNAIVKLSKHGIIIPQRAEIAPPSFVNMTDLKADDRLDLFGGSDGEY